jgi:hypothetical protein
MMFGGLALDIADLCAVLLKWTVYYRAGRKSLVTSDCPVIKIFHSGIGGSVALTREDIEIRFPLSCSALLSLTHDLPLLRELERASLGEMRRMLTRLPEIRVSSSVSRQFQNAELLGQETAMAFLDGVCRPLIKVLSDPSVGRRHGVLK